MGINFVLTFVAAILCVCFAPTAAGPGIPEIKAYLNGVDTPNMFGATTMIVKVEMIGSLVSYTALIFLLTVNSEEFICNAIKISCSDKFYTLMVVRSRSDGQDIKLCIFD